MSNDENLYDKNKVQWSETMHMLDLSANQIDVTIKEGNDSIDVLMDSFTAMANHLDVLEKSINQSVPDSHHLADNCYAIKEKVNQLVIGLQFYDRFTQRLNHVRQSLAVLAELIDDPQRHNFPEEWISLHNKIRSSYSIEQKKTIFQALMQGADIDEVFELFEKKSPQQEHTQHTQEGGN